ncbi:ketoacyl-ACP synthase III [Priestia flexa]|uniref:ketoacyl-ACP synthase III n=1 Tax=Priestia flexa TaxID=86664 RepID=UPI0032EDC91C
MKKSAVKITGIGTYVPENRLTNEDLEALVETDHEWIIQRTGMQERRIARSDEYTSTLAIKAIENLLDRYDVNIEDVDCIIVATTTPDYSLPSVASQIQAHFQISETASFDLSAACAGFTYGLHVANGLITSGIHKKVIVVGSEVMSKITDYTDRTTCVLFGDGAGAMMLEYNEQDAHLLATHYGTDGTGGQHLYRSNLSTHIGEKEINRSGYLVQNGREVYKFAARTVPKGVKKLLEKAGYQPGDVNWFVPHSANLRMIETISAKLGFSMDQTLTSVQYCGNTSSASIPLAFDLGIQEKKVKQGDVVALYGFGGGLTHCGVLLTWNCIEKN